MHLNVVLNQTIRTLSLRLLMTVNLALGLKYQKVSRVRTVITRLNRLQHTVIHLLYLALSADRLLINLF
jgi:hypothetical protein